MDHSEGLRHGDIFQIGQHGGGLGHLDTRVWFASRRNAIKHLLDGEVDWCAPTVTLASEHQYEDDTKRMPQLAKHKAPVSWADSLKISRVFR